MPAGMEGEEEEEEEEADLCVDDAAATTSSNAAGFVSALHCSGCGASGWETRTGVPFCPGPSLIGINGTSTNAAALSEGAATLLSLFSPFAFEAAVLVAPSGVEAGKRRSSV